MSADGKQIRRLARAVQSGPTWSPDGDEIAFPASSGVWTSHIYIINAAGNDVRQLTRGVNWDGDPTWSPDGHWIAYASRPPEKKSNTDIYVINAMGGEPRQLTTHPSSDNDPVWIRETSFSISPSAEKITTLWGELKSPNSSNTLR